jgi:hypothetical protein
LRVAGCIDDPGQRGYVSESILILNSKPLQDLSDLFRPIFSATELGAHLFVGPARL